MYLLLAIQFELFAASKAPEAVKVSLATHSVVQRNALIKRSFRRKKEGEKKI
jgi:hypothetical protein